jgi:hypothetical protein
MSHKSFVMIVIKRLGRRMVQTGVQLKTPLAVPGIGLVSEISIARLMSTGEEGPYIICLGFAHVLVAFLSAQADV